MFELHPQLTADTRPITKLEVCGVYLMNDKRYPWLVLVPRIEDSTELHRLPEKDYYTVQKEVRQVSFAMDILFKPKKNEHWGLRKSGATTSYPHYCKI